MEAIGGDTELSSKPFLKIAVEHWVPWTKLEIKNDNITILGPMGHVMKVLTKLLNFEYELLRPSDHSWGIELPDGSWTGMVGMLHRNEVEFAIGPFGVTPQRAEVCDFSFPLHSDAQAILTVRPGITNDIAGFLKPFSPQVWMLILFSGISIGIAMILIAWGEGIMFNLHIQNLRAKASTWVFMAFSMESSEWMPDTDGARVIVVTWLIGTLVFMSSYSGILTAMITVPHVVIPIDSLAELASQKDLPWRLETGSMMYQYFQESEDDEIKQKIFRGISGTFPDCWSARQDIATGKFAGICDKTTMKKAMSWDFSTTGKCHLYIAKEKVYTNLMLSMAFRLNSSYLMPVNKIIMKLKEGGLIYKWLGEEITNTTQCLRPPSADREKGFSPLSLDSFYGLFLATAAGMLIGVIAFVCELFVHKVKSRRTSSIIKKRSRCV